MVQRAVMMAVAVPAVFGCSWDYPIWIPRTKTADPLYRFVKNGKAGYIDGQGKVVIPATLPLFGNGGSEFQDGLLEIGGSNGRYVDPSGRVVLDPGLHRGWDFSEGLAVAMRQAESLWGYINTKGAFAIPPRFETFPRGYVFSFSEGLAKVEVKGRVGFIDRSGRWVIEPRLLDATDFSDGRSRVVLEGPCVYLSEGPCPNPRFPGVAA